MDSVINNATKTLISAPVVEIKNLIRKLDVDDLTKQIVKENCDRIGYTFPNTDVVDMLRKEWINDVLTLNKKSEEFQKALKNPSEHFQIWSFTRINNPFKVSQRIIDKYTKKFGFEFTSLFEKIRWNQELSWAKKFRNHHIDDYCVFSGLFLTSCKKNSNKVFSECIEIAFELSLSGLYLSDYHDLNSFEINKLDLSEVDWDPVFIRYSKKTFSPIIDKMNDSKKSVIAQRARDEYLKEQRTLPVNNEEQLSSLNLSNRLLVVMKAITFGFNSNKLNYFEKEFLKNIDSLNKNPNKSLEQYFLSWLREQNKDISISVDKEETARRIQSLSTLNSYWLNSLSDDMKELGAESRRNFTEWRDLILSNKREAPENLISDYFFYLIEEQ